MIANQPTAQPDSIAQGCPAEDQRKISPKETWSAKAVEIDAAGVWRVFRYDVARQILRSDLTEQAGFHADEIKAQLKDMIEKPSILFLDGEEHHRNRRETNKFFTPAITDKQYRTFMERFADDLIGKVKRDKSANLNDVTMDMATQVAAQVVGLTNSRLPGMKQRLLKMLNTPNDVPIRPDKKPTPLQNFRMQLPSILFLLLDVKPAIAARRRKPQNDVISYLISRNYSDLEILTECTVYGVAGMITTREFICVAFLHLMDHPHLRQRMIVGSQEERYAILHEILRLEPIVGHLYRRTTALVEIDVDGQSMTIPPGTMIDLNVYASNLDSSVVGENGTAVCPARDYHSTQGKVGDAVLSFGDGAHRCPGSFIAIQESDIFLQKLLSIDTLRIVQPPELVYNEIVQGQEIHNLSIVVD